MTKEEKRKYKKVVSFLKREIKKGLQNDIQKIVREEIEYALKLIVEVGNNPIKFKSEEDLNESTPAYLKELQEHSKSDKSNKEKLNKKKQEYLNVAGKKMKMGTSTSFNDPENVDIGTGVENVTIKGHDSIAKDKEGIKTAINIQTKDYRQLMKKMMKK